MLNNATFSNILIFSNKNTEFKQTPTSVCGLRVELIVAID